MKKIWERNGLGRLMRRSSMRRTDEHSSSSASENFEENANRISPKSKSRETEIGLECQVPENSHYKKDTPGGLTPSQEHREVRKLEPFEDNEIIFKISKFNYVGLWKWDVDSDSCAICLVVFCDPCHTVSKYYFHCLLLN